MYREYRNSELIVYWDSTLCIHVSECVKALPQVFRPQERPWVNLEAASAAEIIRAIDLCPTGALRYSLPAGSTVNPALAGGPGAINRAGNPEVSIKAVAEGALLVDGPVKLTDNNGTTLKTGKKVALCCCGKSQNKPFCDGRHKSAASEEQPAQIIMNTIRKRRSIRKFQTTPIPDQVLTDLIEAARLAPSGCNSQPWRFKIVKDEATRKRLEAAAYNQKFISQAPVVIVCCADLKGYVEGTATGLEALEEIKAIESRIKNIITDNMAKSSTGSSITVHGSRVAANVTIAVQHMILVATAYGLGSCWVRLFEEQKVREIFNWDDNTFVVALLPLGYADEEPGARPRLNLEDILL